jgi:hypothetical protein
MIAAMPWRAMPELPVSNNSDLPRGLRDGDLEIVVSWRLIKDSQRGGSGGRNRRAWYLPRVKRRVDAVNQIIVAKWFWQVANDSETEGLGSNIFVRLSGNQNGGNAATKRLEAAM